jgi:hypothetical protein
MLVLEQYVVTNHVMASATTVRLEAINLALLQCTGHTTVPDVTPERGAVRPSPSILRPLMDERAGLHVSHS